MHGEGIQHDGQGGQEGLVLNREPLIGALTTDELFYTLSTSAFPQRHAVQIIG